MNRIARFEKVSWEQYRKACMDIGPFEEADLRADYDAIQLPKRSTKGSAGYDFYSPWSVCLGNKFDNCTARIPLGVRCIMEPGWVLIMCPRSSLGTNYRLQFDNTISVIDSDFSDAENEGHIFIQLTNDSKENRLCRWEAGDRIAQGIFLPYGITEDDNATGRRTGGIGSTGK